ncbi:MAG: dihydroorotate dehydrogenase [Coriobacteriales bacterium]|jgi:dihydroorotate dehydrogenase (NAD+) catalytic subunit|nr:dihydroorotate dehydrogenase [Coriobacteriales bacterium]
MVDLSCKLAGLNLKNPLTVASGTFGLGLDYAPYLNLDGLGALTSKGVALQAWPGNPAPRICEVTAGMLNSVGLQNPGVEAFCEELLPQLKQLAPDLPLIVNVCSHDVDQFAPVIARLESEAQVSAYELNISCPNLDCGGMAFGVDPKLSAAVVKSCRKLTERPLFAKLTPNVTDITLIAKAVEDAGADAISLINTVTGMAIDPDSGKPKLARAYGGLSGPAIKPIAVYQVWRCHQAVKLPIIGMGGVSSAGDVIELMRAGATAVAVGSATFHDINTISRILSDLEAWAERRGLTSLSEIVGQITLSAD